jgi:hypothetical protein
MFLEGDEELRVTVIGTDALGRSRVRVGESNVYDIMTELAG